MIGLDTGFFVELLRNNSMAVRIWEGVIEGDESVVSCLTLYELKRLSLKGVIESNAVDIITEAIRVICRIVWLDNTEILMGAATISQSHNIHAMDSLILASLFTLNVKTIYTTDSHMEKYKKKSVNMINMIPMSKT
ncbi:MAG: type II toxin-antitoxin system VapC family toxin [Deltaproteobacteria bacterium]|nr:type II toxin-antitoxin system VapC family toxin [Deltaproteobacteria bacterium]